MLYISYVVSIHTWHFQEVSQLVKLLLWYLLLIDYYGIVQVTTLDEVCL